MRKIAIAFVMAALSAAAFAQDYPNRTVHIIVPYTAGSTADITARVVAERLGPLLGQSVVVENRAGANGAVAMQFTAKSRADGYTLVVAPGSAMSAALALSKSLPYDPVKDFAPVAMLSSAPIALVVGKDFPANTIQEFVALAKASPNKHSYAASGGLLELSMEALKQKAGISLVGITYKGPSEAAIDVMAGRVDILSAGLSTQVANVQGGRMKALAVLSPTRATAMPSAPTMIEAGYKDFQIVGWTGLFAPAGTPQAVINRLNSEVAKIMNMAEVKKQFDGLGLETMPFTPAQLAAFLTEDIARFEAISKAAGIQKR